MSPLSLISVFRALGVVLAVAFAAQVAVVLSDASYRDEVNLIAPVFGLSIGVVLLGGLRYLPLIFAGVLIPSAIAHENFQVVLSLPIAVVFATALTTGLVRILKVDPSMETIRDALLVLLLGCIVSAGLGSLAQSFLLFLGDLELVWSQVDDLILQNWLAAAVGALIVLPFILTWGRRGEFEVEARQFFEVVVWFCTLMLFAYVTFSNWAPTDVLLYPMELAIFPIMAWSAVRLGLRGASAGVLVLTLVAAWILVPVVGPEKNYISQDPANVWIFVGIVSFTAICLAAVMTELRKREAEIAENESRLRAFTDGLPDIGFVLSRKGQILDIFVSSTYVSSNHRIVNVETARGKWLDEIFDEGSVAEFLQIIEAALDSGEVKRLDYSLESVDLGQHWFDARVSPISVGGVRSDRVVWMAYNITQRKRFEAAILRRDGVLQATARANNALLTTEDFQQAVETAIRELGYALRVERMNVFEFELKDAERPSLYRCQFEWCSNFAVPSIVEDPVERTGEFDERFPYWPERLKADGHLRLDSGSMKLSDIEETVLEHLKAKSVLVLPMWLKGELSGFFTASFSSRSHRWTESEVNAVGVLASGISGLILIRENESSLQEARELADAASLAKGEFLAVMSHEIRTPINAIIGYSDMLALTDLDAQQSEQAAIIKRSGRNLVGLINNILDYSKIEARTLEIESTEFDLDQVICEALEFVLPMAKEKALDLDYKIEAGVSERYLGDPHRIRQILMNLASNAVKFTDGGSVMIGVCRASMDAAAEEHRLIFSVRDTGVGIDSNKYDRLFKPFSQVDSSTTREFGGTGLGLAISQRLVERLNGRIWVESEVGVGSTFFAELPFALPEKRRASRAPFSVHSIVEPENTNVFSEDYPLRLLVCEDDEDNRLAILGQLQVLGYEDAVAVADTDEVIEVCAQTSFDVILMDIRLPRRSGIEFSLELRAGEFVDISKDQYLIAVTAYAMREDRDSCLAAGMNDYIRKPLEMKELKQALKIANRQLESAG